MNRFITFSLLLLTAITGSCRLDNEGWENLFNGKDLKGWKQLNGQAKYEVKDGMIIGTTVMNTPNSFLVTDKNYSDFVFEVDLLVSENMNSGIQFRSESMPDYQNGRVHGYQCEVDPSERAWSGGIYDEARRGWLYPGDLNPKARSAFKMGEWNHYRIECIGSSLRTWLNGIPVAWVIDDMTPTGFIALQVHSIGKRKEDEGHQIKWKNIRIRTENLQPSPFDDIYVVDLIPNNLSEPETKQGFELLFDGNSTNGWKSATMDGFPEAGWEIKDGILSTIQNPKNDTKKRTDIVTLKHFKAFDLRFDFNLTEGANSGVKYYVGNGGPTVGCEYQVLDDQKHPDAKAGIDGNRTLASLYDLIPAKKEQRFVNKPGTWNRGRIIAYPDGRIEHWLNGRKVLEFKRGDEDFLDLVSKSKFKKVENFGMVEETPILIQYHGNTVHYRSIKIKEL